MGSIELTASKVVSDNNRLRTKFLEGDISGKDGKWRDEEVIELKFLLGEYKARNKELLQQLGKAEQSNGSRGITIVIVVDLESIFPDKFSPVDSDLENDRTRAREAVHVDQIKQLEKAIQKRDHEIHHLQNLLGERVVSNISDTTTRLIYLEEHSRKLEEVFLTQTLILDTLRKVLQRILVSQTNPKRSGFYKDDIIRDFDGGVISI